MSANIFGERFRILSFGESHGSALGVVIDGCPAGITWDENLLLIELDRRRPGQSIDGRPVIVTDRNESDRPELLSGVYAGKTIGTPIAMLTRNMDARSQDYDAIATNHRPGHADDVWQSKFGHTDPRGGGRSSGRETVSRVMAGAVARMFLKHTAPELKITGFAKQIGPYALTNDEFKKFSLDAQANAAPTKKPTKKPTEKPTEKPTSLLSLPLADRYVARFPSPNQQLGIEHLLLDAKQNGKSYGGCAELWVDGCPSNLGQPVFHKLKADLASACLSVGAASGFEFGSGNSASVAEGSEFHCQANFEDDSRYGGIRGGISTGDRLVMRVYFKPTSSVLDVAKQGRHDPCIVPRAIPVLEAMIALVLADHLLWARTDRAGPR